MLSEISYDQFFEIYKQSIKAEKERVKNQSYAMYLTVGSFLSSETFETFKNFILDETEKEKEDETMDKTNEIELEKLGIKVEKTDKTQEFEKIRKMEVS